MGIGYITGLIVVDCGHDWRTPSQVTTKVNSELTVNNFQSLVPKGVEVRVVPSLEPTGVNLEKEEPYDIYSHAYINIWGKIDNISWIDLQVKVKNMLKCISNCQWLFIEDVIFKMKLAEGDQWYDKTVTTPSFKIDYET